MGAFFMPKRRRERWRMNKLKMYEITFAPTLKLTQEVVSPYDEWDTANVAGNLIYVSIPNHDRQYTEVRVVEATSKETAKAMFAVSLSWEYAGMPIKGSITPYIIDRIRNITSITER